MPASVTKPDYANDGRPKAKGPMLPWQIEVKTAADIAGMRAAGRVARELGAGGALSVPLSRLQIRRLLGGAIRKGTKDDCGLVVLARELPAV